MLQTNRPNIEGYISYIVEVTLSAILSVLLRVLKGSVMSKPLDTTSTNTQGNLGMVMAAVSGITSITLLVLAACMPTGRTQYDALSVAGILAISALALVVVSHHKRGNTWCEDRDIDKWSFAWLFATRP